MHHFLMPVLIAEAIIAGSSSTFASGTGKTGIVNSVLTGGSSGTNAAPTVGELDTAYTLFADTATVDVNLVIGLVQLKSVRMV